MENEIIYLYKECNNLKAYKIIERKFYDEILPYLKYKTKDKEFFMLEIEDLYGKLFEDYLYCIEIYNYKKMNNFILWSRKYLLNQCLNSFRTAGRKKREFATNFDFYSTNRLCANAEIELDYRRGYLNKKKSEMELNRMIELVYSSNDKLIIDIFEYRIKDLTFKEIAEKLNLSQTRIYSIWYRFINKTRKN